MYDHFTEKISVAAAQRTILELVCIAAQSFLWKTFSKKKNSTTLKIATTMIHFIANQYFLVSSNVCFFFFSTPRPLSIQNEEKEQKNSAHIQALSFRFVFVMRSWNASNRHVYVE